MGINIKLMNATNAVVTYQVITNQRTLAGGLDVTLQNIKTPLTVTFVREDKGLLKVSPKASQGLLEVTLDESTNLDEDQDTVRVEKGGTVSTELRRPAYSSVAISFAGSNSVYICKLRSNCCLVRASWQK